MAQQSIIRLPVVKALTGLSRSSIYAACQRGEFPDKVSLGARAVGWFSTDIENWIATRVKANKSRSVSGVHND